MVAITAADVVRKAGLRATNERVTVLDALMRRKKPIQLTQLAKVLRRAVHQASVYRIISELVRAGIVRRIEWSLRTPRYEFIRLHHHHLVCTTCGTVEDIELCTVPAYTNQILKKVKSFSLVSGHTLELFGTCSSCYARLRSSSLTRLSRIRKSQLGPK